MSTNECEKRVCSLKYMENKVCWSVAPPLNSDYSMILKPNLLLSTMNVCVIEMISTLVSCRCHR